MMTPFRFFAGGRWARAARYMSWIHRLDWIEMVRWIVQTPERSAPSTHRAAPGYEPRVRARPRPLTERPALVPAPAFALRLALGEFAN